MTIGTAELREIAKSARASQPAVYGYCYPTSKAIVNEVTGRDSVPNGAAETRQVRLRANNDVKHEVATVKAGYVDDVDADGVVIIDATLDQYCTSNKDAGDVRVAIGDRGNLQQVYLYESIDSAPYYFG